MVRYTFTIDRKEVRICIFQVKSLQIVMYRLWHVQLKQLFDMGLKKKKRKLLCLW